MIHLRNNYDLGVFNGDIGRIVAVSNADMTLRVRFLPDQREVEYQREQIAELELVYAITIHKAQGSEFEAVILPVFTQHFPFPQPDLHRPDVGAEAGGVCRHKKGSGDCEQVYGVAGVDE